VIDKVVLIVNNYFTYRDYNRYGIEILENKFITEVWDLSLILSKDSIIALKKPSNNTFDTKIYRFNNLSSYSDLIIQETNNPLFISTINYSYDTIKIFRDISLNGFSYACTGPYSCNTFPFKYENIKRRYSLKKITKSIINKIVALKISMKILRIKPAIYFFLAGGERSFAAGPVIWSETKTIKIHAADYDLLLKDGNIINDEKNIVYIDQYFPFHPDWKNHHISFNIEPSRYYSDLRNGFDKIEKITGLNIVIAAHPKAYYYDKGDLFGNRKIYHNQNSFNLVKNAKIVLVHNSSAISQSILLNKSMIFLTSDLFNKTADGILTNKMANFFNTKALNTNDDFDDLDSYYASLDCYNNYKESFIKQPGTIRKPFWNVVSDLIINISKN
jgi:hypothetical protein